MTGFHRRIIGVVVSATLVLAAIGCSSDADDATPTSTTAASGDPTAGGAAAADSTCAATAPVDELDGEAAEIVDIARQVMDEQSLRTVGVSVTRGGEEVVTAGLGETLPDVPAEPDRLFWNGAVAYAYLGTLVALLDEEGTVDLDATVEEWLPDTPRADEITIRMLAASTTGLVDFVPMESWIAEFDADPFDPFTLSELEAYVYPEGFLYDPGTNWSYSHLNYHLLGAALEGATGQPLEELLTEKVIEPLGLERTRPVEPNVLPEPFLRTFSDERGLYEDTSSWSPAWGVPRGAVIATDVCDMVASASGVLGGELLSEESYATLLDPGTVGLGEPSEACPQCRPQTEERHYGLAVVVVGDWIVQTPLFTGIAGVIAYLPSEDLAIAASATYAPGGDVGVNGATQVFTALAPVLAPDADLPEF